MKSVIAIGTDCTAPDRGCTMSHIVAMDPGLCGAVAIKLADGNPFADVKKPRAAKKPVYILDAEEIAESMNVIRCFIWRSLRRSSR
jgi:hypothetical protein